jgi:outer membrane biosynthesis protein TonB
MAQKNRTSLPLLLSLVALVLTLALSASASAATQAKEADGVVESIGVNTHLGYNDTIYNNFPMVRQRLQELGIRYIREGVSLNRPDVYSRLRTLAGDGIHLDVIAGDPQQRWEIGTIDQQLNMIEKELSSSVVSIEGPNEYDIQGDSNWLPVITDYTKRLWEGVKAHPKLANLPVVGPSITRRNNMEAMGDLTPWTDYGNTHTYLSGAAPETSSIWSGELGAAAKASGSEPVQVTETGYHNAINSSTSGHQPASEKAAGIYMPRLFLENFNRGTTMRSFSYELLDERNDTAKSDIEANFGLLRNDFSKKPAAVAIERLIGLLSDKGPKFTPGSLSYSVEGAPSTAQQMLLQKRDGSFYLVLWNRVSAWSQANRTDLDPADVPVTVKFGQSIASAETFEPNVSAGAVSSATNPTSLKVNLSERVSVIKLVPGAAAPAAQPAPQPAPQPSPEPAPTPAPAPSPTPAPESTPTPAPAPTPSPTPAPAPEQPSSEEAEAPVTSPAPKSPSREKFHNHRRPSRHSGNRASSSQLRSPGDRRRVSARRGPER